MMKILTVGILITSMVFFLGAGCDDGSSKSTPNKCTIGDVTVANGELNPENGCEKCDVLLDAAAWSPNDGATCDDGLFCTVGDTCEGGACSGQAKDCRDRLTCNGDESCNEETDACDAGEVTCDDGQVCNAATDECIETCTGCNIGGVCYGEGQTNPTNPCEVCTVATSASAWSDNDGATCDDGLFCTIGDTCEGTVCGGTARNCTDGVACNGDESCNEGTDTCDVGVVTCGTDEVCDATADSCVLICTGCNLSGVCYGEDQRNPSNTCEICHPDLDATAWSANDGATCDDGLFCTVGDTCNGTACEGAPMDCDDGVACNGEETCDEDGDLCARGTTTCPADMLCDLEIDSCVMICTGCIIDGVCYGDGQANPLNACLWCDADISTTYWSDHDGVACDDQLFCTVGETCDGGNCGGGAALVCDDGVACNGEETCDELNDTCDAGTTTCGMGEVCDVPQDRCFTICRDFSITPLALAGPFQQYGFCWYLGAAGQSCDQVCAALGGTNLANAAASAWPDHCGGAGSDDISYWYYHNGNAAGWASDVGSTSYKTLGYGYTGGSWFGKCASGTSMNHGTFPGDPNNSPTRALVCPCM